MTIERFSDSVQLSKSFAFQSRTRNDLKTYNERGEPLFISLSPSERKVSMRFINTKQKNNTLTLLSVEVFDVFFDVLLTVSKHTNYTDDVGVIRFKSPNHLSSPACFTAHQWFPMYSASRDRLALSPMYWQVFS